MASKATLEAELLALYDAAEASELTGAQFAASMATAIDNYIKTFLVQPGIVLTTPDTISGTTTGTGTLA